MNKKQDLNQDRPNLNNDRQVQVERLVSSRWRWITATLCILSFSLGLYLGDGLGRGKTILYIGSDVNKYNNAMFGCLIK